ncbi:FAD-binding oxidoreductase [Nocardioides jishulii]|uniref:Delta(24)-sterol reductase n=1 Tax=Nocardioides jishulii TaxID=2575440 RepID=A0A4U2YHT8_9ACTN|nr:FAD-binding oxidoreductase [Nocardioides jishulii]QCX27973.1 FAD-binding oxidoreductase [Nocardioides jishulii]TKI60636.1 FAD-binding oxidoreductase [Nocardioides jishulii]
MSQDVAPSSERRHETAVARLRASYAAIPPGAPVRLAKRTSNLFRARDRATAGLEVDDLDGVLSVDPVARRAEVQGMCTYQHLVEATLPHGLMPLVVPQLRTITLGGAVTGLGIESTSFRHGLPHESVVEMDVLTGRGDLVTCRPGDELFDAFPNSYGSLGYATRLSIELAPIGQYVALRHVRFSEVQALAEAVDEVVATGAWEGVRVDGMDGVAFAPGELVLTLATFDAPAGAVSDYTGQRIYHRSVRTLDHDLLTAHDYLWRWDTDWFWCARALGLEHPVVRRLWPAHLRHSEVYQRVVSFERRRGLVDRVDRWRGRPQRERVIQDVEVPLEALEDFLTWFDAEVGMRPVWLCPLRLRGERTWPTYPLHPGQTYVNVGFWGTVPVGPGAEEAPLNRAIERRVTELGGHKSLYSDAFYEREEFDRLYGGESLARVKAAHDPDHRLSSLYDKAVQRR